MNTERRRRRHTQNLGDGGKDNAAHNNRSNDNMTATICGDDHDDDDDDDNTNGNRNDNSDNSDSGGNQ